MDTIKTLLVPVDYSHCAEEALRYAVRLATRLQGDIVVVHVVQPIVPVAPAYTGPLTGFDTLPQELLDNARKYLDELGTRMDGIPYQSEVCLGAPAAEIVAMVGKHQASLVVMGTHGRSALSHLLMGSTTEAVLRESPVPVLAVRQGTTATSSTAVS